MTFKTHKDLKLGDLLYFKSNGKKYDIKPSSLFYIVIGFQFDSPHKEIIMFNISKLNNFICDKKSIDLWLSGSPIHYEIPDIIR